MDFQMIIDWVATQGIWCALFVWLFYQTRKESNDREEKLTTIVESQGERLTQITETLSTMNERLDSVEEKLSE